MTVAVVGSRTFTDRARLFADLDALREEIGEFEVISGGHWLKGKWDGPKGADYFAEAWARERGVTYRGFPADWDLYGRAAGPIRNRQLVHHADLLVAYWDGISAGTEDAIEQAKAWRKRYRIHWFGGAGTSPQPSPPAAQGALPLD